MNLLFKKPQISFSFFFFLCSQMVRSCFPFKSIKIPQIKFVRKRKKKKRDKDEIKKSILMKKKKQNKKKKKKISKIKTKTNV